MDRIVIDEVTIPASVDLPEAADFVAAVEVRNAVESHGYGVDDVVFTPAEVLPAYLNLEFEPKRMFVARVAGEVVARGVYETLADPASSHAWFTIQVHPEHRDRGVGSALHDLLEGLARADGITEAVVYAVSRPGPGERIDSPTGFGSVPRDNPEVQFLLHRGYRLEQIERGSRLALPALLPDAPETPGYGIRQWVGATPERWVDDLAVLHTRMSTDAPSAGLDEPEDVWTAERVRAQDEHAGDGGRTLLVTAVEHIASGRLAGYTELVTPAETTRVVEQRDTIVLREHRGHRLGMLLKVANLAQLQRVAPGYSSVLTFNAEENRHMLDVNEALGFTPIGYEGAWKKTL
jgi:GNAT superfamily N-acetyltransferase